MAYWPSQDAPTERNSFARHFDSLGELIDHAETAPIIRKHESCDSLYDGYGDWSGAGFGEAMKLAREGWPEGRKALVEGLDTAAIITQRETYRSEMLDVAGAYPFVPAAVAGDACCMVRQGLEHAKTRPIFRLVMNAAVSGSINGGPIFNRGAAILSWVDRLEATGGRCEIIIAEDGYSPYGWAKKHVCFSVTAKRAEEPLDLDRMAFLLMHPATQRRLFFRCYECQPELCDWTNYGVPSDFSAICLTAPRSVFFNCLRDGQGHAFADMPTALKTVGAMIEVANKQPDSNAA